MVIKIPKKQPTSFRTVITYNLSKVFAEQGKIIYAKEIAADSIENALACLNPYLEINSRMKKENRIFSCSINPHPEDKVSDETFKKIAIEFMTKMGYGNQPYLAIKHTDTGRTHMHIIAPRIDITGKKIDDSFERRKTQQILQELELKYNLVQTAKHNENQSEEILIPLELDKGDQKKQMAIILKRIIPKAQYLSIGELNCILERYNLMAEETRATSQGKNYDGIIYFALDEQGNKIGPPIKGSAIARGVGIWAIRNKIKKNKSEIKPELNELRTKIDRAMEFKPTSEEEFKAALTLEGVRVKFRHTDKGRIYGVTFIDDDKLTAVNGSRLGKGYSANSFNYLLHTLPERIEQQKQKQLLQQIEVGKIAAAELVGGVLEGVIPDALNQYSGLSQEEFNEMVWQKKLKRQQKNKNRRRR